MKRLYMLFSILITLSISAQTQMESLYNEGCSYEEQGKYEQAIESLKKANQECEATGASISRENADCLHHIGRCYLSLEKVEGLSYAQQAADIRKQLFSEKNADYINSLNNIAQFKFLAKDYASAVSVQEQVVVLCGKLHTAHPKEGMFKMNLGNFYLYTGQNTQSEKIFTEQLHTIGKQKGTNSLDYAQTLDVIGYFYYFSGDEKQAVKYYEQALQLYPDSHPRHEKLLDIVAGLYTDLNDGPNMEKYTSLINEHNKKELLKECDDADCYYNRAQYYASKGEVANAKDAYLKALSLCDGDKTSSNLKIRIYNEYASFLYMNKDFEQSSFYYGELSKIILKYQGKSLDYAEVLYKASLVTSLTKDFERSIDYASLSADVYKQLQGEKSDKYINAIFQRGRFKYSMGNYDSAMDDYTTVLQICRSAGGHTAILAEALDKSADVYVKHEKYTEAEANYKESASLYKTLGNETQYNAVLVSLNRCYVRTHDTESSKKVMEEFKDNSDARISKMLQERLTSLKTYKIIWGEDGLQYADVLQEIGSLYYLQEDLPHSLCYYRNYIRSERSGLADLFRSVGSSDRQLLWKPQIKDLDQLMVNALSASDNAVDSISAGFSTIAYDVELLSKGILLNSSIEFEKILKQSGNTGLDRKYQQVCSNQAKIIQLIQTNAAPDDISKLRLENERLQIDLMKGCAEYGDYTKYMRITSKDVQSTLKDNDIAIEFAKIKTGIIDPYHKYTAIILKKGWTAPKMIPLISQENLDLIVDNSDIFKSNNLCDSIWGKLAPYICDVNTIYMSADGDFYKLPIEYLPYNGKPISEQFDIYRLSSTKELAMNRTPIKYRNALLLGGIDYDSTPTGQHTSAKTGIKHRYSKTRGGVVSFDTLPNTLPEVNIASAYLQQMKMKTTILKGNKADRISFMSLSGQNTNILHIATHGDFGGDGSSDESAMDCSILALAGVNCPDASKEEDGIITAHDISTMDLRNCGIAVLSACQTGMGKVAEEGVFGLQRGFKNAGVRTLLMSLYNVDDAATAMMMSQFYKNFAAGKTKRQSFISAQEYLRTHGYNNSRYWSAFIMLDGLE